MVEKQSISKGFTALSIAGIINKVLAVLYVPFLTIFLGDMGNGIYNAGYTIYILVFVITNAGIPVAISKLVSEQQAVSDYRLSYRTLKISGTLLISMGLFSSIIMAVFAKQLAVAIKYPEAYLTILALSPTLLFTTISCTFRGYFQGRSNMMPTGVSQIIEQAVNSVLTVVFAWVMLGYGRNYAISHGIHDPVQINLRAIEFAAAGGTVGTSVGAMFSAFYLVRTYYKYKAGILNEMKSQAFKGMKHSSGMILKKIFKYAVPITLGAVAIYAANIIDLRFVKDRLVHSGFSIPDANAMYGIFSTQYLKVIFIPVTLSTALATTIIPAISSIAARKDREQLGKTINKCMQTILMLSIPSAVGITVLAEPIVHILFPTSPHGADLLVMGSWILVLISVVSIQTAILQGIGKTYVPTVHLVVGFILKIILNYNLISIKAINIKGALIGSAVCYSFACYTNYRSIKKYTGVRIKYKKVFNRPLSVSIIMGMVIYPLYKLLDIIAKLAIRSMFIRSALCGSAAIASGCLVYFSVMVVAGGITGEDIKRFPMGGKILRIVTRVPFYKKRLIKA
ncbi:MAG TPA: polysaccharide biosynthesis protein [Clostridia bacterium]|nr:polysaccharide biosynthesis protein [Clostridia bacterium]